MRAHRPHRRRGSTYIAVAGTAMIVTVIGISSLTVARVQRRATEGVADFSDARWIARSAIELGVLALDQTPAWRGVFPHGDWAVDQPLGEGTYSLNAIDPSDADFADSPSDRVLLTATGMHGEARFKLSVELEPYGPVGFNCLDSAIHAGGNIGNSGTITATAAVSTNSDLYNAGTIDADAIAAGSVISIGSITGTTTSGAPAREMPDGTVFDDYISRGTVIDFWSIPEIDSLNHIQNVVISPASNPYGVTTNAEGIYIIDCLGESLIIEDSRIVGTLVLLNPGPSTSIRGSVNWEPAADGLPALMIQGSTDLEMSSDSLDEDDLEVNFNPAGTPYGGNADTDEDDTYPSVIKGLCYVSGAVEVTGDPNLNGVLIVGGRVTINSGRTLAIRHDAGITLNPPPGFERAIRPVKIATGTWKQLVD